MARLEIDIVGNSSGLGKAANEAVGYIGTIEQKYNSLQSKQADLIKQGIALEGELNNLSKSFSNGSISATDFASKSDSLKAKIGESRAAVVSYTAEINRLRIALEQAAKVPPIPPVVPPVNPGQTLGFLGALKGQIVSLAASYISLYAVIGIIKNVSHANIEMSDSLIDVRRTAKLTADEASNLALSLEKLNTRTNITGLLDIGFIGGQLHIAKKDLEGYIKTIDQLAVVLKREFPGGADAVATSLGKINAIYKTSSREGTILERSLEKTGSAILALAHDGQVNTSFLQDFALRVAGVANASKIALPTILAYGAVLSEAGITAQVAGTAFTRLASSLAGKRDKFFAIAQLADSSLTLKEFTRIINTDASKALELFFKGLKAGNPSTTEFTDRLNTLKFTTGPAKNAIIALAEKQDQLNQKVALGTKGYDEGSLSAENFALKNANLAASVDHLSNAWTNLTTSTTTGVGFFQYFIIGLTGVLDKTNEVFTALGKLKSYNPFNYKDNLKAQADELGKVGQEKEKQRIQDNRDRFINTGTAKANLIKAKSPDESSLKRTISSEQSKLDALFRQSNFAKAFSSNINNSSESIQPFIKKFKSLQGPLLQQQTLVESLKAAYKDLYQVAPQDTVKMDIPAKKAKAVPTNRAPDILTRSANSADNVGVDGVKEKLQKLDQVYAGYYKDLQDNAKKSAEGRKTLTYDLATLEINKTKERSAILRVEAQRVADEIDRINNVAAEKVAESKAKELAEINKRYDAEVKKAGDVIGIISALNDARFREENAVTDKYETKRLDDQQKLNDKIQEIQDKGFTFNENLSKRTLAKNREELKTRLKDVSDYFDKLRKLNTAGDLGNVVLGLTEKGIKKDITNKSNQAGKENSQKIIDDFVSGFGVKFFQTLTSINQMADRSFGMVIATIGESLGTMLNDVFSTQLSTILKNLVNGLGATTTQALAAAAGVVGGLISGITKKTSSVGQAAGGALTGAGSGALIGSAFGPGPGTVIGAVAGGLIGAIGGLFGSSKARKEQEALQKQQLEEAKKQTELMRQSALTYTSAITGRMTDQGILTNVDIGAMGELKAIVSGKQIDFILARNNNSRG
jgi:TP901 family phage tail tape measure protein